MTASVQGGGPFINRLPFGAILKEDIESEIPRNCRGRQIHAQTLVCESRPSPPAAGLLLGYARVSKGDEQNNALQARALEAAGCRRLFEEAASGGRWDRPELHRMLDHLREGDTVVVWKLDRLSRSLKDVLHIMERIAAGRRRLPLDHREHRHHHPGRPDDDADGRRLRRVRARHDPGAHLGRSRRRPGRGAHRRAAQEARCRQAARNRRERHHRPQDPAPRWRASTTSASQPCRASSPSTGWPARSSGSAADADEAEEDDASLEEAAREERRQDPVEGRSAAVPALPDRRAMEGFLAAIGGRRGDNATAKAQDMMYEAWERTTSRSRIALARKALGISPLCADAYVLLAEEAAQSIEEARDHYAKGVEAGELALGPHGFKEYAGHFWGFLETRPYMRARAGLASALLKLGDVDGAIEPFPRHAPAEPERQSGDPVPPRRLPAPARR